MTKSRIINAGEAIREGLEEAAKKDPNVLFFAEGVQDPSSVYGTLKGIGDVIGHDRMLEMPVAENGLCGVAIGAAMMGMRPVISFHRVEFALLALEQIFNNAAKSHYVSNGQHNVPIVLRLVVGRGWGQGPAHSQSLETLFGYIPGLKVIMPTFAEDAKGMIISAVEDNNPVICIESRWTHYANGHVPLGHYKTPLDGPKRIVEGNAMTIVGTSYMTLEAKRAADELAKEGVNVEVFDLRVIRPLIMDQINASVKKTGALMTVDTGFKTLGIGSEITSQIVENNFGALKKAPVRLGLPDHPTPSTRGMIGSFYPDAEQIVTRIGEKLELSKDMVQRCITRLQDARGDVPIDVPDSFFKGPF